jgi:hypothetical protein
VDDTRILLLDKKAGKAIPLEYPWNNYTLKSPNSIFEMNQIAITKVQLDVSALLEFDKDKGRQGPTTELTLFMRTATGSCNVNINGQLAREMERTTKKKAPPKTDIHLQFSNYDEYESSSKSNVGQNGIFKDLTPGPKDQGRIFIGFPTHQTTGASIQLAAHLIPTVERESIDFVDRTLNVWNQDLLTMGGLLSRIVYEEEMRSINELYEELDLDAKSEEVTHFQLHTRTPFLNEY